MGVLGIFRRSGIRGSAALADFLDQRAMVLARNCVDEYTKSRAGPFAEALFADAAFGAALERARREAYPIALTMLAEMIEGVLRPHLKETPANFHRALEGLVLTVFNRHPAPAGVTPQAWLATRDEVVRWLDDLPQRRPKPATDITEPFAPSLLAIMPIHDMLHGENFPALQNYLRASLAEIRDDFSGLARSRALMSAILQRR